MELSEANFVRLLCYQLVIPLENSLLLSKFVLQSLQFVFELIDCWHTLHVEVLEVRKDGQGLEVGPELLTFLLGHLLRNRVFQRVNRASLLLNCGKNLCSELVVHVHNVLLMLLVVRNGFFELLEALLEVRQVNLLINQKQVLVLNLV